MIISIIDLGYKKQLKYDLSLMKSVKMVRFHTDLTCNFYDFELPMFFIGDYAFGISTRMDDRILMNGLIDHHTRNVYINLHKLNETELNELKLLLL